MNPKLIKKLNILLIDDDKDEHILFEEALKKITAFKYHLYSQLDGDHAMHFLLKKNDFKNSNKPLPDIIFLDLNMPRMDGYSTLRTIKSEANLREIPLYIFTNSKSKEDAKITNKLGSLGFFTKSVDQKKLVKQLEEILFALHT